MSTKPAKRLFCFGLGYSVQHLAATLPSDEWQIAGTVRSSEGRDRLSERGWEIHLFDGAAPLENAASALKGTTHLIDSAPPSANGDPVLLHHAKDIANLTELAWMGYLSTTGVYGDRGGDWVDEDPIGRPPAREVKDVSTRKIDGLTFGVTKTYRFIYSASRNLRPGARLDTVRQGRGG